MVKVGRGIGLPGKGHNMQIMRQSIDLIQVNFPYRVSDDELTMETYKLTIPYLRKNLTKDEEFLCHLRSHLVLLSG